MKNIFILNDPQFELCEERAVQYSGSSLRTSSAMQSKKKPFYTNVIKALTSIKSNEAFYESLWDYINIDPIPQE